MMAWSRRAGALAAALAVGAAGLSACSRGPAESIDFAMDGLLSTYNTNTVAGAASGGPQAFARVLTGFNYHGPDGQIVGDHDFGKISVVGRAPLDQEANGQESSSTGSKLRTPHLVAGHWKGVWMGSTDPERAKEIGERRKVPKWIKPYPRCGNVADQIHATYKVDLPDGGDEC